MDSYLIAHCIHVNCVMLWMVGMFALPWLFVFHKKVAVDRVVVAKLEKWEHHLLRYWINPALIITVVTGIYMVHRLAGWQIFYMHWFQAKLVLLIAMFLTHGMLARYRKAFIKGQTTQSTGTYINASFLAMLLMVCINTMVLLKPF